MGGKGKKESSITTGDFSKDSGAVKKKKKVKAKIPPNQQGLLILLEKQQEDGCTSNVWLHYSKGDPVYC